MYTKNRPHCNIRGETYIGPFDPLDPHETLLDIFAKNITIRWIYHSIRLFAAHLGNPYRQPTTSLAHPYSTLSTRERRRIRFTMNKSTSRTNANAPAPVLETGRAISDQIMLGNLTYDNVAKKTAHVKVR